LFGDWKGENQRREILEHRGGEEKGGGITSCEGKEEKGRPKRGKLLRKKKEKRKGTRRGRGEGGFLFLLWGRAYFFTWRGS